MAYTETILHVVHLGGRLSSEGCHHHISTLKACFTEIWLKSNPAAIPFTITLTSTHMIFLPLAFRVWNPVDFTHGFSVRVVSYSGARNNHVVLAIQVINYHLA